ncbi:MAG TPA: TonB-dependent receptor plug domain-containing protein, partial [Cellvibrionaceae bacterium]
MNRQYFNSYKPLAGFSLSLLSLAIGSFAHAQQDNEITAPDRPRVMIAPPVIEEMMVTGGRLMSGAESLIVERQEQAVATDFIGAEQMSRVGDSNVAIALTRVPGITLVENKFVFVRGLGERYSSTTLNGAMVPSPDLSRNVLPLDIIPTSIVESLAIQKVPSADKPAAFGGGSVDIRTSSIPDDFVFSIELSTGLNTESSTMLTYNGGSDDRWGEDDGTRALSPTISDALDSYRGNLTASHINQIEGLGSISEAQAINRNLALELNRDLTTRETSGDPDLGIDLQLGNIFYLPND